MHLLLSDQLNESLHLPASAQLCDEDSGESSDDGGSYTNDDARRVYQEELKEQPKHNNGCEKLSIANC